MALATRNAQAASADGTAHPTLLVAGDSDFATNRHFATLGNGALFTSAVTLLAGQDALLTIRPRHYEGRRHGGLALAGADDRSRIVVEAPMKPARALWPLLLAAGVGLSAWQWHEATEAPAGHGGHTHLHDDAGKPARLYSWDAKDAVQVTLATPAAAVTLTRGGQGWAAAPADRAAGFDAAARMD
ncbi:hypothetical protein G6F35_016105 [Rhizopus arrhizus]|nr:hypothetical protein G6F35_016105 [Rhizopus arrhizus]